MQGMEEVPAIAEKALPHVAALPLIAATAVMVLIGALWYSSLLFGKAWVRHTGIRATDIRAGEKKRGYAVGIITSLAMAYLLGLLVAHSDKGTHLFYGVGFIWFFIIVEQLNGVLWRRDPIALFFLQAFRSLFTLIGGVMVFYLWG